MSEKAILVGISGVNASKWETREHIDELTLLANTAGAEVVDSIVQERKKLDSAYCLGKGKADFLAKLAAELDAGLIVFDDDLTPAQAKNLENLVERKVIDRSGLILDIFANRAKSREARTQVELAQLQYLLPRLTRQWTHLSRQVGGIGTRGPGETQLEVDRRLIRKRIHILEKQLKDIEKQRKLRRRQREGIFKAALVGYTNVGKSTIMNAVTNSKVFVENRLFATLDATVREVTLNHNDGLLLIDTVGFIRKLPHHLIASFKSTLEEARDADALLHIVDITSSTFEEQMQTVRDVLTVLELNDKPVLHVFNKIDKLENTRVISAMREKHNPAVFISAARGLFLQEFRDALVELSHSEDEELRMTLRAEDGKTLAKVHSMAEVQQQEYRNEHVFLRARTSKENAARIKAFAKAEGQDVAFEAS